MREEGGEAEGGAASFQHLLPLLAMRMEAAPVEGGAGGAASLHPLLAPLLAMLLEAAAVRSPGLPHPMLAALPLLAALLLPALPLLAAGGCWRSSIGTTGLSTLPSCQGACSTWSW